MKGIKMNENETLKGLLNLKKNLEKQIKVYSNRRNRVLAKIIADIEKYQFTPKELKNGTVRQKRTVEVKFRDSQGNQWSGRGKTPNWLKGKNKEDFRIIV